MTNLRGGPASEHPLYATWNGIKQRCLNPNVGRYPNYGGRGIRVHAPWIGDFWAFAEYVSQLDHYGEPGRSIDRYPDVNGHYEPGNLRWATASEQMQNTRAQLDPMNGIQRDHGKSTFYYQVTRDGELYAEYGFATSEDAATGRDYVLAMLDAGMDALAHIRLKKDIRQAAVLDAQRVAEAKKQVAAAAKADAREAARDAIELEKQARLETRQDTARARAERWAAMNKSGMSLAEVAQAEGVSTALVSLQLKRHGIPVTLHNSTGYPGVKEVTKRGRTYYEARMVVDGARKTLGQRKTAEEAYALIVAAKAEQASIQVPETTPDSGTPRRTVQVRRTGLPRA